MTKSKFDEIWNNIVLPIYKEITPENEFYIKHYANEKIYKEYQKQKNFIRYNYMEDINTHLDRHKIAACIMFAIVKVHPLKIKKRTLLRRYLNKTPYEKRYVLLNEYLALYSALSVVESFRQDDIKNQRINFDRPGVCQPMTTNGESYIHNTCLDLYFAKRHNKINILTFANVFFLLETGKFVEEKQKVVE